MSTNYIDQITDTAGTTHDVSEGDSTRIFRATCSTAAGTAAKVATLQTSNRNFSLATGVRVAVTFTYGNSAATPTLRVDGSSTGTAKTIAVASSATAKTTGNGTTYNTWGPYETVLFTYDGTYWVNGGSSLSIYNAYNQAASAGTGTVTSVGLANATNGGLTVSGSPITTSGTINVGHTNILTNAQTTQAVYPITIDKNGHISGYGSAVTIPTAYTLPVATYNTLGGVKPWKSYTASSTGPTAATASTAVSVNTISNTASRYYAVEMDKDGRMFVNVPWIGEANVLEGVQIDGTDLTITSKKVNIPLVSSTNAGVLSPLSGASDGNWVPYFTSTNGTVTQYWEEKSSSSGTTTTWYGTSSTTASTAAKVVTCSGFTLTTGAIIGVLFSTANTAATPTLNVNSTGAKTIYVGGNTALSATTNVLKWSANTMIYFMYDGTYFRYITSVSAASVVPSRGANTWYGTSSTSATTAAKTSTIDNYVLTKGAVVSITFSTANTYSSGAITLNVNSTGAKTIYYNNAATSATNLLPWDAGETVTFIYSGSYYYFVGKSKTSGGGTEVELVRW